MKTGEEILRNLHKMGTISLDVKSVCILHDEHGPDHILIYTTLPQAVFPYGVGQSLELVCAANTGKDYLKFNFPEITDDLIREVKV